MVSDIIHCTQLNVQHSRAGTANLCKDIADLDTAIAFVQEPWINKEKILGFGACGAKLHRGSNDVGPRLCILTKDLVAYSLRQFGVRDTTTVCFTYTVHNRKQRIIAASIYMPIEEHLPPTMPERICMYCKQENLPLIVAFDTNAYHLAWGGADSSYGGKMLSEFLATSDLGI